MDNNMNNNMDNNMEELSRKYMNDELSNDEVTREIVSYTYLNHYPEENLFNSYKKIKVELSNYDNNLIKKREIIFFNKSDLLDDSEIKEKLKEFKKQVKTNYEIVSVYSNKDIQKIKKLLVKYVN